MALITIEDKTYDLDQFSSEARLRLTSLQAAEGEIRHLNVQLALAQTARATYIRGLLSLLPAPVEAAAATQPPVQ